MIRTKEKQCENKTKYDNEAMAKAMCGLIANLWREGFDSYLCPHCNLYHIGHSLTPKRTVVAVLAGSNKTDGIKEFIAALSNKNYEVVTPSNWYIDKISEYCLQYGVLFRKVNSLHECRDVKEIKVYV